MESINIVVAGYGPVGQAVYTALTAHKNVILSVDDSHKGFSFNPSWTKYDHLTIDGVIVCVATPMAEDGSCTTKHIEEVIAKYGSDQRYLIKSAVDPVFISNLSENKITVSPEFLRGTTGSDPTQEFLDQTYAIYGGGDMRWWHELFKPTLPKLTDVKFVSREQAAFAKYTENTFLAAKVAFFNQLFEIYNAMGFDDFDVMVDAACVDPRLGTSHTQVPGPDGKFGYGGHCFPKDVSALIESSRNKHLEPELLAAIQKYNTRIRGE